MRLLNLFSGTGSVSKPWRKEHEVWDVDIDPRFGPETCEDILQWDYKQLPWIPDAIWASPPCTEYARCRTRGPPRNFKLADSLVAKALEIIHYFEQKNPALLWFLENGDSTLLWGREVAKKLSNYVVLDYCQYGTLYRKRTRIAHSANLHWEPRPLCDPKTCHACPDGRTHLKCAQRGPKKSLKGEARKFDRCTVDELHALPEALTEEIMKTCESHMWEVV